MLTKTIFAAGALLSVAAAVPMQKDKRDVVWTTQVEEAYVTVDVTTTIWLNPGETPPVAPAGESPGHYGHGYHHGHKPKTTSTIMSTVHVSPPAASSSPAQTYSAPAAPTTPSTTSTPVAPVTTSAPVATTPTSTWSAPPAYTTTSAAPASSPSSSSGGSSGSAGGVHTGDITYYTPGMGSCGITSSSSEAVVALPEDFMVANDPPNPNDNPYCGKTISISYGGKTTTATVVDTCPGCAGWSIDLSPSVFSQLAPLTEGRVSGVEWSFT